MKKIIGTAVPLSALYSEKYPQHTHGTFDEAMIFLNWLKESGQNAWVMLPISETQLQKGSISIHVPSPYKGYGIGLNPKYASVTHSDCDFTKFQKENAHWLDNYALFCALREHYKTDDWSQWHVDIRNFTPTAVTWWEEKLAHRISHFKKEQCVLHTSFMKVREKAKKHKIFLVGDVPFYMSLKSPLVWSNQELFDIEPGGLLVRVSGVPWGHFDRQIWGHPLYKWGDSLQSKKVLGLWKLRLHYYSLLFDVIRLDHVKAFFKFGVMDLQNPRNDRYEEGPGEKILQQLIEYATQLNMRVIVEDSGYKLGVFLKAVNKYSLATMKIFRFAYNEKKHLLIHEYSDINDYPNNSVVYSTTHDTETLVGYLSLLNEQQKKALAGSAKVQYSPVNKKFARSLRTALVQSKSSFIIIPIQDWLLTKDRINIPGTEKELNDPNWRYRLTTPIERLPLKLF